jgi:hypothetical protein
MLVHRYIFLTCRWSGSIRGPLSWELGVLTIATWWPKLKNMSGNPLYNKSMTLGTIYWQKRQKSQSRTEYGHLLPYFNRIKTVKTKSNYSSITARIKNYNLLCLLPYLDRIKTVKTKSNYDSIRARIIRPCFLDFHVCSRILTGSKQFETVWNRITEYLRTKHFLKIENRITVDLGTKHFFKIESEKKTL